MRNNDFSLSFLLIQGDQCKFDHDAEIEKKKEMCKFYVQGYCTRGENCLYLHNILYHKVLSLSSSGMFTGTF